MTLSDLVKGTRTVPLEVPGGVINLEVCPGRYTLDFLERFNSLTVDDVILELATGWDLTQTVDGAEVPVPLDGDGLKLIGIPYRRELFDLVMETFSPNLKTAAA